MQFTPALLLFQARICQILGETHNGLQVRANTYLIMAKYQIQKETLIINQKLSNKMSVESINHEQKD